MTPFALLLQLSGLSQREVATFLEASPSSVDKWARGARNAPQGIIAELRDLIDRQASAADEALSLIDEKRPDQIEIGYPSDDQEAQSMGWPCVGAWRGMAAHVVAGAAIRIELVPRGSTVASAAASDQFHKSAKK